MTHHRLQQMTRVQLDLSPDELQRLNQLMYVTGIRTRKDLFNNALSVLEWAAQEVASGKNVGSIDPSNKEYIILSMPALSAAAARGHSYRPAKTSNAAHSERDLADVDP